mmetsp:Transcript_17802/g.27699  ORF Transcript_17802/g.27699 Transcript_17802/m.27699 type:complete len:80 (+) Transcript_17802:480-719(+)
MFGCQEILYFHSAFQSSSVISPKPRDKAFDLNFRRIRRTAYLSNAAFRFRLRYSKCSKTQTTIPEHVQDMISLHGRDGT